ALDARAGLVPLPTTLDQFVTSGGASNGNYTTVAAPNEVETFGGFSYHVSVLQGNPPVLPASQVTLSEFHSGIEAGITFSGACFAPANTIVDYAITYTVTAPPGFSLTDAVLSGTFSTHGGDGSGSVTELFTFPDGSTAALEINSGGKTSDSINFAGVSSILV